MAACEVCGASIDFPRQCTYCEGIHCPDHMLPENYDCAFDATVRRAYDSSAGYRYASEPMDPPTMGTAIDEFDPDDG